MNVIKSATSSLRVTRHDLDDVPSLSLTYSRHQRGQGLHERLLSQPAGSISSPVLHDNSISRSASDGPNIPASIHQEVQVSGHITALSILNSVVNVMQTFNMY